MPELIVRTPEDYLQMLLRLTQSPFLLQKIRMGLWKSMHLLNNTVLEVTSCLFRTSTSRPCSV